MTFLASEGFAKMPRALARGASLESILDRHGAEVAAVIVEPLCQGAAGMRLSAPACLAKIAELCRRHQVLLIADEIAVGYGRTGRMFACEHAGVDPDIVCLGKGMSGGYLPISATVVKHGIYETFKDQPADRTFYHGHTFAGNPIAAALALEVLRVYREEGIVARAERLGHLLRRQMERFADLPGIKRVRTLGMIAALDLEDAHGQPAPARACAVREALLAEGILLRPLANTLYLMPPLIISEDVLTGLTDQLYCALKRS
jgi:adenosylmethionine-8-amino-7-oxononanoate aminotransferase